MPHEANRVTGPLLTKRPVPLVFGRYKDKNTAARAAATARATSKSRGVRIGRPRRGTQAAFGAGTFTIGRVFIVSSSYPAFRRRAPRITGFAGLSLAQGRASNPTLRSLLGLAQGLGVTGAELIEGLEAGDGQG
jgi:hypothetical protein